MPDLKNHAVQQQAMMEAFFFAYQAFTTKRDEMGGPRDPSPR
ncbi:hypothetical protein ACLBVR_15925, partial [Pseudomonas aeruginosa]